MISTLDKRTRLETVEIITKISCKQLRNSHQMFQIIHPDVPKASLLQITQHMHALMHTSAFICAHALKSTFPLTIPLPLPLSHTHTHKHTNIRACRSKTLPHTHTRTCPPQHKSMTHTNARTHGLQHTHIRTHTHKQTRMCAG